MFIVKSVDLDSWTNEQVENMIRWGNARANKYWEAKLIPGHIPSERLKWFLYIVLSLIWLQ